MGMKRSQAKISTDHATSYLRQLCRHWAHKFPVTFDDSEGRIELPSGVCLMQASSQTLSVQLELPDTGDEAHLQRVVAEHLQRFGFRETLVFDWQPA